MTRRALETQTLLTLLGVALTLLVLGLSAASCTAILGIDKDYKKADSGAADTTSGESTTGSAGMSNGSGGSSGSGSGSSSSGGGSGGGTLGVWPDSATALCVVNSKTTTCPTPEQTDYDGQDGDHLIHVPTYTAGDDGSGKTFTDSVTGLVWQGNFSAIKDNAITWTDALVQCKNLDFAGQMDWRLPSRRELASLLDAGRLPQIPPMSSGVAPIFPKELDELIQSASANVTFYWTDARVKDDASKAWAVIAVHNTSVVVDAAQSNAQPARALCVRGTEAYRLPQFVSEGEVVRDATTGLVWERVVSSSPLTWTKALVYCNALTLGGMTGFRLPNVKELLYLVDDTRSSPSIDPDAFPGTPVNRFWTSTPSAAAPNRAFLVDFTRGNVLTIDQTGTNYIRCVR